MNLFEAGNYVECLFWMHLTLEKIIKAHWVKDNPSDIPPKIHNLRKLAEQTVLNLTLGQFTFLDRMNECFSNGRAISGFQLSDLSNPRRAKYQTRARRGGKSLLMLTQQAAIDIADEFVLAILAKGFPLKKAILFGSYVRNEQHEWSDIDMALVADEFIGLGYFDMAHFMDVKISSRKYTDIEPHTFRTDYFEKGDPFIDEIKRTGIELPLKKLPIRPKRPDAVSKISKRAASEASATSAA